MIAHIDAGPLEDASHPIPRLDTLDVHLSTDKGAYVGIVIATPLKNDNLSKARLQRKIELSLEFFLSSEYRALHGVHCRAKSRLWIKVHADTDAEMLALIEHYRGQIEANNVSAIVQLIGTN